MKTPLEQVDFERIKDRFDAFWRGDPVGPALVAISCPKDRREPRRFRVPDTPAARWTDIEYQCRRAQWETANTTYLGDALPMFLPNLGPDSFTAFLGGELEFLDDTTSWVKPFVDDIAAYTPVFDPANKWWRTMCELLDAVCGAARGRFLVGVPDMHGGGDSLAAARHPDRLALDLYDEPEHVRRTMLLLTDIYEQVFDEYATRIGKAQEGSITWIPAYSRGRYVALQNDFSGLVSPAMFADFFLPELRELSAWLDDSIYHLDGPSALGNLPYLLDIEELDGIQWVPGAGQKPMSEWLDVCRQVLDAGKRLQIGAPCEEVEYLLSALPHRGLFITTWCASEREGRQLLERLRLG